MARFLPVVQVLGRGLISSRSELFQQGTKVYNSQNFNNHNGTNHLYVPTNDWKQSLGQPTINQEIVNKTINKSIAPSCLSIIKEFKDNENEHAHSVLTSLPAYRKTTIPIKEQEADYVNLFNDNKSSYLQHTDWSCYTSNDVAKTFIQLSEMCRFQSMDLENVKYSSICQSLASHLPYLQDNVLLNVLKSLSMWPSTCTTTTPNFMLLWNTLDIVSTNRMRHWNIEQLFLVADHWYALRLSRITKFNNEMVKVLGKHIMSMSPSQLVQYLFYANLGRQLAPFIVMKDLEKQLIKAINYISIDELGVIAMGFFKTQTFPKNISLLECILKKTKENLHCVSDPSLGAILKLLRRTIPVSHWAEMLSLMDCLNNQVDHLNHMCLLQIALLGNDLLVFHPEIIGKITNIFANNIGEIRLKDLERLTFVLMLYNFIPPNQPDILDVITEELKRPERREEIHQYPRCFMSCIVYLVTMGHLVPDLVSAALHPNMLKQLHATVNYNNIDREINELDWAVEIEAHPEYKGNRIDASFRNYLTKKYIGHIPNSTDCRTHQERLVLEVHDKLSVMLGGDQYITTSFILPHNQNPDLVFCTNKDGFPVPLPEEYLNKPPECLKNICEYPDLEWNAVIVGGRNSFIRNTDSLRGTIHMKKRQMLKLGYHVAVVPFMKFSKKSLLSKLKCLEHVLDIQTSLDINGRVDASYAILQGKKSP